MKNNRYRLIMKDIIMEKHKYNNNNDFYYHTIFSTANAYAEE